MGTLTQLPWKRVPLIFPPCTEGWLAHSLYIAPSTMDECKELPQVVTRPTLQQGWGSMCYFGELLEPSQALAGVLAYMDDFQPWCRHPKSHMCLGEVWNSQWSRPSSA